MLCHDFDSHIMSLMGFHIQRSNCSAAIRVMVKQEEGKSRGDRLGGGRIMLFRDA